MTPHGEGHGHGACTCQSVIPKRSVVAVVATFLRIGFSLNIHIFKFRHNIHRAHKSYKMRRLMHFYTYACLANPP